ncbi:hypothetical protein Hanom_Chr03g00189491 [Helianthus anomalus]
MWARDIAKKDRVIPHAKSVQEELECKTASEAQKMRSEITALEHYQALTVEVETSNAKAQAKQAEQEEREGKLRELQQYCDPLLLERNTLTQCSVARLREVESALEQTNVEVDSLTSQLAVMRGDRNWLITNGLVGAFEYLRQSTSFTTLLDRLSAAAYQSGHHDGDDMDDALEAVCNEPLCEYADLMDKVNEEGIESLRVMLDHAEESEEE